MLQTRQVGVCCYRGEDRKITKVVPIIKTIDVDPVKEERVIRAMAKVFADAIERRERKEAEHELRSMSDRS